MLLFSSCRWICSSNNKISYVKIHLIVALVATVLTLSSDSMRFFCCCLLNTHIWFVCHDHIIIIILLPQCHCNWVLICAVSPQFNTDNFAFVLKLCGLAVECWTIGSWQHWCHRASFVTIMPNHIADLLLVCHFVVVNFVVLCSTIVVIHSHLAVSLLLMDITLHLASV